jgi:hypothetical protein
MVFVTAAVSAAQKPRQPYGTGHLLPAAHSGIYTPKLLRLTHLMLLVWQGKWLGWFFPGRGVPLGGLVWPPKRPAP